MKYQKFDEAYGRVICKSLKGSYVMLDNGETVFALGTANIPRDTLVICSVLREADENRRASVLINSVLYDREIFRW